MIFELQDICKKSNKPAKESAGEKPGSQQY